MNNENVAQARLNDLIEADALYLRGELLAWREGIANPLRRRRGSRDPAAAAAARRARARRLIEQGLLSRANTVMTDSAVVARPCAAVDAALQAKHPARAHAHLLDDPELPQHDLEFGEWCAMRQRRPPAAPGPAGAGPQPAAAPRPTAAEVRRATRADDPRGEWTSSTMTFDDWTNALKSFDRATAAGPSGITSNFLQRLCFDERHDHRDSARAVARATYEYSHHLVTARTTAAGAEAVRRWQHGLCAGTAAGFFMSNAVLHAFHKPKASGRHDVRPIACGEVLRRTISRALVSHAATKEAAVRLLLPHQFGVAVPFGMETVAGLAQLVLDERPDTVLLSVDAANAFNRVDRVAVIRRLEESMPHLAGWVRLTYAREPTLYRRVEDGAFQAYTSAEGVQQGDPLGPLLYVLATQPVLEGLQRAHADVVALAAHDDKNILTRPHSAVEVYDRAVELMRAHGESPSATKSTVYSRTPLPPAVAADFAARGVQVIAPQDGVVVLGVPLGSDAFVTRHMDTIAAGIAPLSRRPRGAGGGSPAAGRSRNARRSSSAAGARHTAGRLRRARPLRRRRCRRRSCPCGA